MIYLTAVLILICGLICTVLFARTRVVIEYSNKNLKLAFRNPVFRLTLDTGRLGQKKAKTKAAESKEKTNDSETETEDTAEGFFAEIERVKLQYTAYKDVFNVMLKSIKYKVRFSGILLRITYGTGNAAHTGMLYGAFWALMGNLYSFLCRYLYVEFPDLELNPQYEKKTFELYAEGIITVRLVHIINAALRTFWAYRGLKKKQK